MTHAAIAASSEISAEAGAQLAGAGGNAVDAVLGSALASMCTDNGIMSRGAGFTAVADARRGGATAEG